MEVIGDAILGAVVEAHAAGWARDGDSDEPMCPSCQALIELGSRYGDPTGQVWPDPVRRHLMDVFDAEIARRG